MELKESKTEKNIMTAFVGESQARNRYTYYASVANKEGFKKIKAVFEETADQEKEHAKRLFKLLDHNHPVGINENLWPIVFGNTAENLQSAIDGEHEENTEMYPSFAVIAKEEGFDDIAEIFLSIAQAEKFHEKRYRALLAKVKTGSMFKAEEAVVWKCRNCGYTSKTSLLEAPDKCPACDHSQAHFEIYIENF